MTTNAPPTSAIIADACFSDLKNYIVAATGMEYYTTRPHALAEHVRSRILENGLNECREYWDFLRDDRFSDEELDRLTERLTIGETHFFRHREVFDALRDKVLPEMLDRNRATQRLRVWSAGCSTGPEAYSISILLRRELVARTRDWNISIVGTDINRLALSQAGAGRYEEWAFRGTPPELRTECFEQDGSAWRIADRFRDGVTFQYHNLARHPVPSLTHNLAAFDLIFCRNVLIYFAAEAVERIVSQLAECLVPGGWLVIGHAEHGAKCLSALEAVTSQGTTLYRKPAVAFADAASLIGDERTVSDTCQRVCRNSAELQEGGRVFAS
ncbi:MAG TPA: protein-glutamate O-methyltransferase CheR, partial [Lacipirellulaceae bacterium]|nr:protein-glutamate O-methyltransferase CheR [Lacipirellulaceae bacterium]